MLFYLRILISFTFYRWVLTADSTPSKADNSLCVDPSLIQQAAKSDGLTNPQNPDNFTKSLTSSNNFINFCNGQKITDGRQIPEGSCCSTPMGQLPSAQNMPSVRILTPSSRKKLVAHAEFNVTISVRNIEIGFFTSPANTYYLAPQQLNSKGLIMGHLHLVIQQVDRSNALDPTKFVFFKGIADRAVNGRVSVSITGGLPDGKYRIATLTSTMNHQLVAVPIAKRGATDDAVYIVVGTGINTPDKAGGDGIKTLSTDTHPETHIKGEGDGLGSDLENNNKKSPSNAKSHKSKGNSKKVCRARRRKRSRTSSFNR